EDGIRDRNVTGVQTCALPISVEDTEGNQRVVRAKYVVGCDGAHSEVRKSIGRKMAGDKANHAWGVVDVVVETDFPDWRTKAAIRSEERRVGKEQSTRATRGEE